MEIINKQDTTLHDIFHSEYLPDNKELVDIINCARGQGVILELYENEGLRIIEFDRIVVPEEKRCNGIGTKILRQLINYADKSSQKITLMASTDVGGNSLDRVKEFYKRLGFSDEGKNYLVYKPKNGTKSTI